MSGYVDPTEQLVTEIVVRDIRRSVDFYSRLGFEILRDG
ncbi:MAG: VOC family protein, partial [Gammaproteobacteria bacterium]